MNVKAKYLYNICYRCTTPGPGTSEGQFVGFWTGDVDTWGKRTFRVVTWIAANDDVDRSHNVVYLFPDEVISAV